jgi:hypothetical protein
VGPTVVLDVLKSKKQLFASSEIRNPDTVHDNKKYLAYEKYMRTYLYHKISLYFTAFRQKHTCYVGDCSNPRLGNKQSLYAKELSVPLS